MFSRKSFAAALAFACAVATPVVAQTAPPAVSAYGAIESISQPALSPDGKRVAVVQAVDGRPAAVIYTIDGSKTSPVAIPSPDWTIETVQWAKNDRLLIYLGKNAAMHFDDSGIHSWGRVIAVSPDGSNPVVLFHNIPSFGNNTSISRVTDLDMSDPTHIFMPLFSFDAQSAESSSFSSIKDDHPLHFRLDLYKVDVTTGNAEEAFLGNLDTIHWYMDGHGNVVARLDQNPNTLEEKLSLYQGGSWKDGGTFEGTGDNGAGIEGLDDIGQALVVRALDDSSRAILLKRNLATGAASVAFADPTYDIDGAIRDEWTGHIIGAAYVADKSEYRYFDPAHQAIQKGLEGAFRGQAVHAESIDLAMDKVVVAASGPQQPPTYYVLDRTTHQAQILGEAYPDLHPQDLGEKKPYPYAARDGLPISSYITIPPGRTAKNLPTVVLPHGGPDARDDMNFDFLSQFLASRGYVVLQPNFRGSSGYGHKFTDAGLHQWGLKMQDDITDGVKKLIADGIADPKRICIVGASYGGYAALAGATFTPDLYACTVSIAGVSDLPQMLATEREQTGARSSTVSFWESRIGDPTTDSAKLEATSPARHAGQVKCPILLIHGEQDTTVRIQQSEIMERALTAAGKQVQFIRLQSDNHYLEHSATRIQTLTEVEKFLKANIGS
jgi:dipeptidyl aminopeptidase/acylaminoacyl peptidase